MFVAQTVRADNQQLQTLGYYLFSSVEERNGSIEPVLLPGCEIRFGMRDSCVAEHVPKTIVLGTSAIHLLCREIRCSIAIQSEQFQTHASALSVERSAASDATKNRR